MHRACINSAWNFGFYFDGLSGTEKLLRICFEPLKAAGTAEAICFALVFETARRGFRHDLHMTYRIDLEEHQLIIELPPKLGVEPSEAWFR